MARPRKGPRLGAGPAHERLLLSGLAAALFTHEGVNTTETKAKAVRPVAERLITFAKKGDVGARREVLEVSSADLDDALGVAPAIRPLYARAPRISSRHGGCEAGSRVRRDGFPRLG